MRVVEEQSATAVAASAVAVQQAKDTSNDHRCNSTEQAEREARSRGVAAVRLQRMPARSRDGSRGRWSSRDRSRGKSNSRL